MSEEKTSTADLAKILRRMASDGNVEEALKTIRASVLTDIADALDENAKLRTLAEHMAKALGVGSEWCYRDCYDEFDCDMQTCPIIETMQELGLMEGGSDGQPTNG